MKIENAKVLITGGSTGIGFETAKMLKAEGAAVTICSRTKKDLEKACDELGVYGLPTDVSDEAQVKNVVEFAISKMGGLNVLINNAGIAYLKPLIETDVAEFTRIWDTNVKGTLLMGRECAKHFVKENYGNIINIGSTSGQKGDPNGSTYCSSKFAVRALTECWRAELRKNNIRVMQVDPSEVITPFAGKVNHESTNVEKKLKPEQIGHTMISMLKMDDIGFITDATVWATNPY